MKFQVETINEFETILNSLTSNNDYLIRALSLFAEEYKENNVVATAFVNLIIKKTKEAPWMLKINFLFLIDHIIRNVGHLYSDLISNEIVQIFINSLSTVSDTNEKLKYYSIRKSWQVCFPNFILEKLDFELNQIEPNWREECITSTNDNDLSSNYQIDSLKSLPIISSKLKSENYVLYKSSSTYNCNTNESFRSLNFDSNKENEISELPSPIVPLWEINIPDYPLFPEIGTDPRLLRRWYSDEKSQNIVIGNKNYKLLLNRIQPCILVNGMLHAVRFYSKRFQLKVNENIYEIPISGASTIKIFDQSYCICLGGPRHELVIVGIAYHIPMDGNEHRIRFNKKYINMKWILEDEVRMNILPEIPSHICIWGWQGMFGSPKYLTSRPLNPMKPLESSSSSHFKQRKVLEIYNHNKVSSVMTIQPQSWKENQKKPDDQIMKRKNESDCTDLKLHKQSHSSTTNELFLYPINQKIDCVFDQIDKDIQFQISRHQIFNRDAVCQLFEIKTCSMCHQLFQYTDQIDFNGHLIEHHNTEKDYELLNDWIVSASSISNTKKNDNNNYLIKNSSEALSVVNSISRISLINDIMNMEAGFNKELVKWDIIDLKREQIVRFSCRSQVFICVSKGSAEIYGSIIPFNKRIELLPNNRYEIVTFTGCIIRINGSSTEVNITSFNEEFYKPNFLLNVHYDLELKRIEATQIEGRGPRILVYGPGIDPFEISKITKTLTNYSVRCCRSVGLVNLDTIYNETGLPNSISVNVIQTESNLNESWDEINDPLIFSFGQCSPVANLNLYLTQMETLANYLNIRCENDNNFLVSGCIINGGNFHSSDIIMRAIELFEVNFLLFISDKETGKLCNIPEYVDIINVPRILYNTDFCPKEIEMIRRHRVESYFYGNSIRKKEIYKHELKTSEISMFYTASKNDFNGEDFIKIQTGEILINSVGALSQALTINDIHKSPILTYLVIVNVSLSNSTVTVISKKKIWPKCFSFILLNGIFLDI